MGLDYRLPPIHVPVIERATGLMDSSWYRYFEQLEGTADDSTSTSSGLTTLLDMLSALLLTTENLAAGDFVHVFTSGGVAKVQKADATDLTKPADGFVLSAFLAGASARVYGPGQINNALAGLTPGAKYWLSVTGGASITPPATSGNGDQEVGKALSATSLLFAPKLMVEAP